MDVFTRKDLLEHLKTINEIAERNDISSSITDKVLKVSNNLKDFKVKVPLVGGFNAGKTSLINHFLQNDKLPVAITPETAIAAEIKYGEDEKILAHSKSGGLVEFDYSQFKEISHKDYYFIECYQNSDKLKELEEIVLVDMSGLDSSIEAHNQAILSYIHEGVVFVLIVDVDYGLKGTVLNFMRELNLYEIDFNVLISKIDHKPATETKEVFDITKRTLLNLTGREIPQGVTSVLENQIDDFVKILKGINSITILQRKFSLPIIEIINKIVRDLEIRLEYQYSDTAEIDNRIKGIKKKIDKLGQRLKQEEKLIDREFSNITKEKILSDVGEVLCDNITLLIRSGKLGTDALSRSVNELIRPTMIKSFDKNVPIVLAAAIENISLQMDDLLSRLSISITDISSKTQVLDSVIEKLKKPKTQMIMRGSAVLGAIVTPWISLVLLFLPDIISLFKNVDRDLHRQLKEEIIPQIIERLNPQVIESLDSVKRDFIEDLREDIEETQNELIESLKKARKDRETRIGNFQKMQEEMQKDILLLKQIAIGLK